MIGRAADELSRLIVFEEAVRAVLLHEPHDFEPAMDDQNYCNACGRIPKDHGDGQHWRELNSCADAVQDISIAISALDAARAAAKEQP